MTNPKLFFFLWNTIGIFVLGILIAFSVEFVNHGSSWDGIFLAIEKHQARAESQLLFGM